MLTFNEYEENSKPTLKHPELGNNLIYPTLGLVGEAGEVAEKLKKIIRDHDGVVSDEHKKLIALEVGDVLWYIAAFARELGMSLEDIARMNIEKTSSRGKRGVVGGSGDAR